jgi:transcriptional regulator of acetoin/glycerol metabolism
LIKTNHNKSLAADILGLPRTTLWRKIKRYHLL